MIAARRFCILALSSSLLVSKLDAQGYGEQKRSSNEVRQDYQRQTEPPKQGYGSSRKRIPGYGPVDNPASSHGQPSAEHQTSVSSGGGLKAFKYTKNKEEYEDYRPVPDKSSYDLPAYPPGYGPSTQGYGPPETQGYGPASTPGYGAASTTRGYGSESTRGYNAPAAQGYGPPSTLGYGAPATQRHSPAATPSYGPPETQDYGPTHPPTYAPSVYPTTAEVYRSPAGYSGVERINAGYRSVQTEAPSIMGKHLYFTTSTPKQLHFTTSTMGSGYSPTRLIELSTAGYTVEPDRNQPPHSKPSEPQSPAYPGPLPATLRYESGPKRYGVETQPAANNPYQAIVNVPYQTFHQPIRSSEHKATDSLSTSFHPEFGYPFYVDGRFWYFKIPTNQLRNSLATNLPYPPISESLEKGSYKIEPSPYKVDRK